MVIYGYLLGFQRIGGFHEIPFKNKKKMMGFNRNEWESWE
jgi:hypothetical protein